MKKLFYLFSIIAMVVLASNVQEIEANDDVICGKSLLNIKSVNEYNGISTRLFISDKHGKLIFPVIRHPGSIITLCKKKKFLLIDTNSNYVPTESFLMSSDMAVLRVFKFGEVTTFGKSKDENIFWVQYFSSVDKIPLTMLLVYDHAGRELYSGSFERSQIYIIKYHDVTYDIKILKPEIPG